MVLVREKTERPEVLSTDGGRLIGLDPDRLVRWASRLIRRPDLRRRMDRARNPYGDGRASARVAAAVAHWFGLGPAPKDWRP